MLEQLFFYCLSWMSFQWLYYYLQVFKNGAWQEENTVEEPYEPGCAIQKSVGIETTTTTTTYCHCTGALCNSASKESTSYHTDAMAVIFVFNAMKYLRSVDWS